MLTQLYIQNIAVIEQASIDFEPGFTVLTGEMCIRDRILLDFVQSPYFTKQTVEKELGIIGQEIKMYDDDPQWRMMFSLLRAMYHTHPIKDDIAGTVESIAEITPE